jgi:hypothetical protein
MRGFVATVAAMPPTAQQASSKPHSWAPNGALNALPGPTLNIVVGLMGGSTTITQDGTTIAIDNGSVTVVCAQETTGPPRVSLSRIPARPVLSALLTLAVGSRHSKVLYSSTGCMTWLMALTRRSQRPVS